MLHYILQTVAFQLIFLVVYDVFLKKETFFNYNRFYLLLSSVLSFLIPFVKIDVFKTIVPQEFVINLPTVILGTSSIEKVQGVVETTEVVSNSIWSLQLLVFFGIFIAFTITVVKVIKVYKLISKSSKRWKRYFWLVTLKGRKTAFSFFNYICLGDSINETDKHIILNHELIHVKQRHSLDLLFFEILRIVFWFNPLVYIYQSRVSTLHEYIADAESVKNQDKTDYYHNLLTQVFDTKNLSFINTFYKKSLIKKRIIMLSKNKSKQKNVVKYLIILPLVCAMLTYTSCVQEAIEKENLDLSQYTYTLEINKDMPESIKKIHDSYEAFLKANKDYVSWTTFNSEQKEVTYSIHSKDEKVPDGYTKTEVNFKGGTSYVAYMNFDALSQSQNKDNQVFQNEEVPYAVIDKIPTYESCEGMTEEQKRKCTSDKISKFVNRNFNIKLAETLNLQGKQRIITAFKIDKEGNITDVRVRAPHTDLKVETERVIKLLPKMIPGEHDGKAVIVPYSLPITFMIQG